MRAGIDALSDSGAGRSTASRARSEGLKQIRDRGRDLVIIGTQNFFVGTKLVKSVVGTTELRTMLDAAMAGRG